MVDERYVEPDYFVDRPPDAIYIPPDMGSDKATHMDERNDPDLYILALTSGKKQGIRKCLKVDQSVFFPSKHQTACSVLRLSVSDTFSEGEGLLAR